MWLAICWALKIQLWTKQRPRPQRTPAYEGGWLSKRKHLNILISHTPPLKETPLYFPPLCLSKCLCFGIKGRWTREKHLKFLTWRPWNQFKLELQFHTSTPRHSLVHLPKVLGSTFWPKGVSHHPTHHWGWWFEPRRPMAWSLLPVTKFDCHKYLVESCKCQIWSLVQNKTTKNKNKNPLHCLG